MSDWSPNPALSAPGKPEALAGLNPDTMQPDQLYDYARDLASNKKYADAYSAFLPLTKMARFKTDKNWIELWRLIQSQVVGL